MSFCDGFDCHNNIAGKWGSATGGFGTISVTLTAGRDGRGAAVANKAWAVWTAPSAIARRTIGFALKGSSPTGAYVVQLVKGANFVGALAWNSDHTFSIIRGSDSSVLGTSTATLADNTWGYLEFQFKASTSISSGDVVVRLNRAAIITLSGGTQTGSSPNLSIDGVFVGSISGALNSFACTLDDVVILDDSESFWGDVTVEGRVPDAAGNYSEFSATGASPNYACVNEIPEDGDTTYVSSSSLYSRDSYVFPGPLQTPSAVKAVQIVVTAKKVGSDALKLTPSFREGGTDYDQTAVSLTTSYATYVEQFETDPATGSAWTISATAALEAGMRMTI